MIHADQLTAEAVGAGAFPHAVPDSFELEQKVVGMLLVFPEALPNVPDVESCLEDLRHRRIVNALRAVPTGDTTTVFEQLREWGQAEACGGLDYLNELLLLVPSHPRPQALKANVEKLRERALIRAKEQREKPFRVSLTEMLREGAPFSEIKALLDEIAQEPAQATEHRSRALDFRSLAGTAAPARHWFRDGWLGSGMTLLPGKGGEGKSGLAQHEATCGALGRPYITGESAPYKSLVWNCEDEHDDLWRRQERICEHEGIDLASLADCLIVESRYGCDNALMAEIRGELVRTRLMNELREQINDQGIDVLWLDNAAHALAGNHDDRAQVTQFINTLNGLVTGRPFAVVVLAHVSRAQGSEYTGSVAWENAARMRWYLGSKLPDQQIEDGSEALQSDQRYLCKRKSNYSARDYVRFSMRDGLLVPDGQPSHVSGLVSALDEQRADDICIAGFRSLCAMGLHPTDGKTSPDYLPSQIAAKGLASGYSKSEIAKAMNRLMARGRFSRGVVGKYPNRSPKHGLVLNGGGL